MIRNFFFSSKEKLTFDVFVDMPYAFCTREKYPWCELAEYPETGPTIAFLKSVNISIDLKNAI